MTELREKLKKAREKRDDEAYHMYFDDLLEEKLDEVAPEWMAKMRVEYEESQMGRWCA